MKKLLLKTMLLLCALVAGSTSVWAESETITFSDLSLTNGTQYTEIKGTNCTLTFGDGSNDGKYYTTGSAIRVYANGHMTVSSTKTIESIALTFGTGDGSNAITVNAGSWTSPNWTGSATSIKFSIGGSSGHRRIASVTVTYATGGGSDPVAVTGVSLDEASLDLEVGGSATLTATVAPGNADNKNVSWESDNTSVATVDENGVVSAVGVGDATITVTTEEGSYTATCDVNVTKAPAVAVNLDLTTNILGLPVGSSNKGTTSKGYSYGGYTYTFEAGTGYYFNADGYVMLGKTGATLTFPAFPFNVSKIKITGGSNASESVKQNIYVGEEAVSTETTGAKAVTNEYEIAPKYQAAGNVYVLKVGSNHNTQITKIQIFGYVPVEITAAGYATLFTPVALDFSEVAGLTAYTAVKDGNVVRLTPVNDVQANTGVVLEGAAGKYSIPAIASSTTAKGELTGNATAATAWDAESGYTYYVLASTGSGVEFRPVSDGEIAAGKAFLKVNGSGVHSYSVAFGDETGISEAVSDVKSSAIYDLSGRRVVKPTRGLYIVNGKKIMVK